MEICLLRMTFYINFYLTSILSLYTVCDVILLLHCFKIYYMCRCVCNWSQTDRSFNCITLFDSKEVNFLYLYLFFFGGISFLWEKDCKDCEHFLVTFWLSITLSVMHLMSWSEFLNLSGIVKCFTISLSMYLSLSLFLMSG